MASRGKVMCACGTVTSLMGQDLTVSDLFSYILLFRNPAVTQISSFYSEHLIDKIALLWMSPTLQLPLSNSCLKTRESPTTYKFTYSTN